MRSLLILMYILPAIAFMAPAPSRAEPIVPSLTDFNSGDVISASDVNTNFDRIEISVDDNAADIDTLTTQVTGNDGDIQTNAGNIQTNADAIAAGAGGAGVTTNATNIQTNADNIQTNADNIASGATATAVDINETNIQTNADNIQTNTNSIDNLSAPTPVVNSYDAILVLDNAQTAAAEWAAFFKPYVAWGAGVTPAGQGQVNVSVIYKLTGVQALVPERDCYDDSGAWAYKACFFIHLVRDSTTDFLAGYGSGTDLVFTDSIGRGSFNAPLQKGWNGMKVNIHHAGRIEIDQDLNNNNQIDSAGVVSGVEAAQKDTIIWEFGNGWNTGWTYNQPAPGGVDNIANLPGQAGGSRAGATPTDGDYFKINNGGTYNDCTTGGGSFNVVCKYRASTTSWHSVAGESFDSETTRANLPIPGPANGSDWLVTDGRNPHDCAPNAAGDGVATLGSGNHEVMCVWSGETQQWYPALFGAAEAMPSNLGGMFINSGDVMVEMIDINVGQSVITGEGRGLPNMSPKDRVREDSNGGILLVGYNDASYINSKKWTIISNGLDLDDIAFQSITSWGSVMPRFTTVGWAYSGLGAWIMGNPNMSETQSAGFKGYTHGWLFGDPVYGDASPKWENCTVSGIRGATDLDPNAGLPDPPNNDQGREGTCVGRATTPRGIMIDASMSEGTLFSTIVSTTPMSRTKFSGFYTEALSNMKGYPIAMGPWMCDGTTGTNPLPKNTVAQEFAQCADNASGGGTRAPFASAEAGGQVLFEGLVYGRGKSVNGAASGPILFGPNSGVSYGTQTYILDGVSYPGEDKTSGPPYEQFIVSDSISSSGGPQVILKTPWPFYNTEYDNGSTRYNVSEYYNLRHVDDRNVSNVPETIQWSSITSADEVAIEAINHRYYESIRCVARGTAAESTNSFTPNVTIDVYNCDHNATNCVNLTSGVNVTALSSPQETVLTTPERIDQGDYLLIDPTVANGGSPTNFSCSVRWHR